MCICSGNFNFYAVDLQSIVVYNINLYTSPIEVKHVLDY